MNRLKQLRRSSKNLQMMLQRVRQDLIYLICIFRQLNFALTHKPLTLICRMTSKLHNAQLLCINLCRLKYSRSMKKTNSIIRSKLKSLTIRIQLKRLLLSLKKNSVRNSLIVCMSSQILFMQTMEIKIKDKAISMHGFLISMKILPSTSSKIK